MTTNRANLLYEFNDAFNRHDVDTMMALMTGDCVFENTYPPPDGTRFEGQGAVRAFWEDFFRSSPQAQIDVEFMFVTPQWAVQAWVYRWISESGQPGHVRGVDLFRLDQGRIAEKLSYVKG